jgi:hypothetical protein
VRSCSLDCAREAASVLPDHTHFFPTETCVLDCHAEERVLVLLVVGSEGILVEQHLFRVIRARLCELGKLLLIGAIRPDPRCMRSSSVIVL